MRLFNTWNRARRTTGRAIRGGRTPRLEGLEQRNLLSTAYGTNPVDPAEVPDVPSGFTVYQDLWIDGTDRNDDVVVQVSDDFPFFATYAVEVLDNGVPELFPSAPSDPDSASFPAILLMPGGTIHFEGNNGSDEFHNNTDRNTIANGGLGNDTLVGGGGTNTLARRSLATTR